jgi:membrane protein insertase Oxa1/YidC/SpoIIIJ
MHKKYRASRIRTAENTIQNKKGSNMQIIIIILIILMILIKLFCPPVPSGVVLYFANIGSGKTTFLSKIAQKEIKKMKKGKSRYKYIVSNALISGVKYVPDIRSILKKEALQDTLILIDEGSIVYNLLNVTSTSS